MELKKSEIDFKLILTKYEQQDAAIESTSTLVKEHQEKYKNLCTKREQIKKELTIKRKLLREFNLKRTENIMKLRESTVRNNLLAEKNKNLQEKSVELELNIKKASDHFLDVTKSKEVFLKDLDLKFMEESLKQEIEKCEEKYNSLKDKEIYLNNIYNELKQKEPDEDYFTSLNLTNFVNYNKK